MKIETKFDIGDWVWTDSDAKPRQIICIEIVVDEEIPDGIGISYSFDAHSAAVYERHLVKIEIKDVI